MATVLKLITTSMPWTFISLGEENESTGLLEESKLFPKNSIVNIKNGIFPHSYDVIKLIGKTYTIGNICNNEDDKRIEITFVNKFCDMSNIIDNQNKGICNIHVKAINSASRGGSRSKSRRSHKNKRSKRNNKNKSKKRNSKY
jgi:hypothetical protein